MGTGIFVMCVNGHGRGSPWAILGIGIVALGATAGCRAPETWERDEISAFRGESVAPAQPVQIGPPSFGAVIVDSPRSPDAATLVAPPSSVETWIVHTRACEQKMGSNPWPSIAVGRLDEQGGPLHGTDPEILITRMTGRTAVFLIHGNGYLYHESIEEAVKIRALLEGMGGLPPETLFIVFDWPSEKTDNGLIADLNEKARRSRIASYHLARFLQTAPVGSRICLLGQSDGGRIALSTMHLLSGAELEAFWTEADAQLSSGRPDLHVRAVILDTAAGHHWLNPDQRLGQALPFCESLLNLRNSRDYALAVYPLGMYTDPRAAIGRVGLRPHDLKQLGPLADRVEQYNLNPIAGYRHTTFPEAFGSPVIAERIATYTSWRDVSSTRRR